MARKPRFDLPGFPQHVVQRGNNRQPCFCHPADYRRYLDFLHEAARDHAVAIHAYVLMTNHVHLLVTSQAARGVSLMMQDVGRRYVRLFNSIHGRTGTLWEGRFKSSLVDRDFYLLACMRYIETNPVRAGMVSVAGDYRWSSYRCNALGHFDCLVQPHEAYDALGGSRSRRQQHYRQLFVADQRETELRRIRDALRQELVLGDDEFVETIERLSRRQVRPLKRGRPEAGELSRRMRRS